MTSTPDKLDSMLFSVQIAERKVRNRKLIAHSQFCVGDVIFILLAQKRLFIDFVKMKNKVIIDLFDFILLFGEEPPYQKEQ